MNKKDNTLKITPDEIEEIIQRWESSKKEIKKLQDNEEKYRLVIGKIMDNFKIDSIKGKSLKVSRYNISRRFLLKDNIPEELYNRYSTKKEITCFRLSKNK